jgi:aldehyde dehydrogenase (NAD+)
MTEAHRLLQEQRDHFRSGATRTYASRRQALDRLADAIRANESLLFEALRADLNKSPEESYATEIGFLLEEIRGLKRGLRRWMAPERVPTPFFLWPAKSRILREPYGVALVLSPWNYPLQLALAPLAGALAAGNCAVVKPSELAPATARAIEKLVGEAFDRKLVATMTGGPEVAQALLAEPFDHVFFTGSTAVGRKVWEATAKHLSPVVLELGGKSPCIVDADVDVEVAARRIAWGKTVNAGQTCVAPDYLLVHRSLEAPFTAALAKAMRTFFGDDPARSPDYGRIVNERHFERLERYLGDGDVLWGGDRRREDRYFAPTALRPRSLETPVMQEEIFGPILPIVPFDGNEEALAIVEGRPKPLAFYVFTKNPSTERFFLDRVRFGGGCVNDTLVHLGNGALPFGGVGPSGLGAYHGRASFEAFSHRKSVLAKPFLLDAPLRYPPSAGKLRWYRKIFR